MQLIKYLPLTAVLLPIGALSLAIPQGKGSAPVMVVNTTDNPVPTVAQGTTLIAGAVGIVGPNTVQIGNTETRPVLVRDLDRPTKQPFFTLCILMIISLGSWVS